MLAFIKLKTEGNNTMMELVGNFIELKSWTNGQQP